MSGRGGKYRPLTEYLAAQAGDQAVLSFAEIEALIGASLPPTAGGRRWWTGGPDLVQTRAWLRAGWRVTAVNFGLRRVTFVRREDTR